MKRKIKNSFYILLPIILLILGIFIYTTQSCKKISCISFPDKPIWTQKEVYEQTMHTYRALYSNGAMLMRIEKQNNIAVKDAHSLTTATVMQIEGLLHTAVSPYPGLISDKITCDTKYQPTITTVSAKDGDITTFIGYLNDRMQYGSCIDDQIQYKTYVALFYCQNQSSWYKLELMTPVHTQMSDTYGTDIFKKLTCKGAIEHISSIFSR